MTTTAPEPLQSTDLTPDLHFRTYYYSAVFRLYYHLCHLGELAGQGPDQIVENHPFLRPYLDEIHRSVPGELTGPDTLRFWQTLLTTGAEGARAHLPLSALAQVAAVGHGGCIALMLVGLAEEDARFGQLFADLQSHDSRRRPTFGSLVQLLGAGAEAGVGHDHPERLCRFLIDCGLLQVINPSDPKADWELKIPTILWDAMRGEFSPVSLNWCQYRPADQLPAVADLLLSPLIQSQLQRIQTLVATDQAQVIILRGAAGSERREMMAAIAGSMGLGVLEVAQAALTAELAETLGSLCMLTNALPVITYSLGVGQSERLPTLHGFDGPVGILLGAVGGIDSDQRSVISFDLPVPDAAMRLRYWEQALVGHACPELNRIAADYHVPGGYIRAAGKIAVAQAALAGRTDITLSDVRSGLRSLGQGALEKLAVRLETHGGWERVVVGTACFSALKELEQRCRYREELLGALGPGFAGTTTGVRALFSGPSGTGKTLAARTLAAVLAMDLYRVDLASVVNKYIGETEKNLDELFSRAEELDVILLLDEGDSLLAKRGDVKGANDRYANLETNYLLQRLESYRGIVLVTTNAAQNIDTAFQRRIDVSVEFTPPGPAERHQVWHLHLPGDHTLAPAFLEDVAVRCAIANGQIRNAALRATLLALAGGERLGRHHLVTALRAEYLKAGAICPPIQDS